MTKLILSLKDKSYKERLCSLSLTTLETTRVRGDIIEVLKIFKGYENLDPCTFSELNTAPTRGHSLKLIKPRCRLDIRKFSFSHKIVDIWNSLDNCIIACDSTNSFKTRIYKFLYG